MKKIAVGLTSLFGAFVGTLALAAPPIPINGPVVISQSGDYIVTRDFAANPGTPAIRFPDPDAYGDPLVVSIDLAGHTISASDTFAILVREYSIPPPQPVSLTLRNGRIRGDIGWGTCRARCLIQVYLDRTTLDGTVSFLDGLLTITSSFINVITADSDWDGARVIVTDSRFRWIGGSGRFEILGNQGGGINFFNGVSSWSSSGVIERNELSFIVSTWPWYSSDLRISRNVIGYVALVDAEDTTISENEIRGCSPGGSAVAFLGGPESRHNRIEDNVFLGGCEYGIHFDWDTQWNTYSGNTLGNGLMLVPVLDQGENNGPGLDVAPE
jgi:hypothetical protein